MNLNRFHKALPLAIMAMLCGMAAGQRLYASGPVENEAADSVIPMSASSVTVPAAKVVATDAVEETTDSTAADFFVNAPAQVFPTIDKMTRMDMIDYFQAGSDKASKNLVGGECKIIEDTGDKLVFTTSPVSEYTLVVLPASGKNHDRILMLCRTLRTPAEDSTLRFYDTRWNELEGLFSAPTLDDWILPEARRNRRDVENAVPFVLAKMTYSTTDHTATFTADLPGYIPKESLPTATSSLRSQLTFRWNGKKLVMVK